MRKALRIFSMPLYAAPIALLVQGGMATAAVIQTDKQAWPAPAHNAVVLQLGSGETQRALTLADLEALPHYKVTVSLIWGEQGTFQGIKLNDLLRRYGLSNSATLRFSAADRYTLDIGAADWRQRDPLIATRFEMRELTIRQKGPLRLLWPDETASLESTRGMLWIWNLVSIKPIAAE
ncbi:molybdopterin-dependent oxidoreductase [Jeongeupia wiesaeckerbachi]|uniref:molybdopterin-dependent oxidoreductase n=1 Tax=Jeongeupia wiesaeckerbachi TaxID=3051218 RepID=UPI003D809DDA